MDSWLSYTLGYSSEATPQDIQVRVSPGNDYHALTRNRLLALLGAWLQTRLTSSSMHRRARSV